MKATTRTFGLDAWRAKAIVLVLCSHILWIYPKNNSTLTQVLELFGFWGVELFFVLSGFLIGRILFDLYVNEDFTIGKLFYFLKRRWFRTLPNYLLVLLLNIAIASYFKIELTGIWQYFLFLQNFSSAMPAFFPESWSLSVEEFAYLLTPFVLFFGSLFYKPKNKARHYLALIGVMILFFFGMKMVYDQASTNPTMNQWNVALKSVAVYRVDSILIGILSAWIGINFPVFWRRFKTEMAFLGFLFLLFLVFGIGKFQMTIQNYPSFWNIIYLPLTSVTFALFLPLCEQWRKVPNWVSKPYAFVSKISYSIYLLHYSLVLFTMKSLLDVSGFSMGELHLFTLAYLLITFLLSYLLYRFYEKPMMDLRDKN